MPKKTRTKSDDRDLSAYQHASKILEIASDYGDGWIPLLIGNTRIAESRVDALAAKSGRLVDEIHEFFCYPKIVIKNEPSEHQSQAAVVSWAGISRVMFPELDTLHATPNGGGRGVGDAGRLKAEGVSAGFPDMSLHASRGGFLSCHLELKTTKGKVRATQVEWHRRLIANGNFVAVCVGQDRALRVIKNYLVGDIKRIGATDVGRGE